MKRQGFKGYRQGKLRIGEPLNRKSVKLLICDEQATFLENIREFAEIMDHEIDLQIRHVKSSKEAVQEIHDWNPSVVMVDLYLTDLSGFELVEKCSGGSAPVVVTSGSQTEELREKAFSKGAAAFVLKTTNPDDLEQLYYMLADLSLLSTPRH